ncbi:hypothetical protein SAMN04487989_101400 [Bizionia echini]|uniref:Uncharacterized protein n=1 Tax=Bizionia echini TaxID=649333 RepID=A0A1I4YZE3_9FLAO|nr:hypothetical protein SAMN04487989_101400 [Bizionia echini]
MNKENKKELDKQESEIRKNLFLVFIPVLILISLIVVYQNNSLEHNKSEYEQSRNTEFSGIIVKKKTRGRLYSSWKIRLIR